MKTSEAPRPGRSVYPAVRPRGARAGSRPVRRALCVLGAALVWMVPARAAGTGRLHVKSTPRGARVYLDDDTEPRARTPCLLRDVPAGSRLLRASLAGYADVTEEVEVPEGATGRAILTFTAPTAGGAAISKGEGAVPAPAAAGPSGEATGGEPPPAEDTSPDDATEAEKGTSPKTLSRKDEISKYIGIDCMVCRGTGLIQTMGCPKCEGTGYAGFMRCRECGGTGRAEHKCPACGGGGTVVYAGKEGICAVCRGKGKFPCRLCGATGRLKRPNPERAGRPTKPCPNCEGTGFESKVKCLRCSGKGKISRGMGSSGGRFGSGGGRGMAGLLDIDCPSCGGDGVGPPICRKCRGSGVKNPYKNPVPCQACSGTGQEFRPCRGCRGVGWILSK